MVDKPFSKRHGYSGQPREIIIREGAPENLRHFVLDTAVELGLGPNALRAEACSMLHVRPDPGNWSDPNVMGEVEDLIYRCDWFRVYDFMERVYRALRKKDGTGESDSAGEFENAVNDLCLEQGIGWKMVNGEIVSRGTEAFEGAVQQVGEALGAAGRTTAKGEIHEALADLSRRPKPDLTRAVQNGMAALECAARDAYGDPKATLGDILKKHPGLIPKPHDPAIEKAWGYASEMGRHVREGREPERKEVELIVGLAATVSTYLSR